MNHKFGTLLRLDSEDGDIVRVISYFEQYKEYSVDIVTNITHNYPFVGQVVTGVKTERLLEYIPLPDDEVIEQDERGLIVRNNDKTQSTDTFIAPGIVLGTDPNVAVITGEENINKFIESISTMFPENTDEEFEDSE